jgi:HD-GYP domain-containing protein (c-di-GMP phosphodiesterase class II)
MNNDQNDDHQLLYNSRIVDSFIKLIEAKYSSVNIHELLSCAGMKSYEVGDQGHWFTQEQINRFHRKAQKLTGNDNIAREAGRYAASPNAIGVIRHFFLGFVSPAGAFEMIRKGAANLTRSSIYECNKINDSQVEIIVTPRPGVKEEPFQCENRMGCWEAIVMIFTHKLPTISHKECIFKGGKACRYIITWERTSFSFWKKIRSNVAIAMAPLVGGGILWEPYLTVTWLLPLSVITLLLLSLFVENRRNTDLKVSLESLQDSTDKLLEQININYNNALMTNEVGQAISRQARMEIGEYVDSHTNINNILNNVAHIFDKRLDYKRGLILLANPEKTKLEIKASFGYEEHMKLLEKVAFHLDRPESQGAFVVTYREQKPLLVNNLADIEDKLSPRSLAMAKKLGAKSFICCPIICDGESIGVLAVDNPRSNRPLVNSDMSLLMGIAPMIGISVRNAEFIDARNRQFKSLLQLLAATIDARDSLTAGHSEKVTEYAVGICQEMGLPANYREMIRVAALLHDYGKIAVPDAVLKKNGRLTDEEYEVVKTHSEKTREILEQISFEGIFLQVPEIAGAHHEKMDGSGYPQGLKGKEIPLGARIIAVADFFEAITAKRHYREPMPLEAAFRLLHESSGKHFDRKVVKAFSRYFLKSHIEGIPAGSQPGFWLPRPAELPVRAGDEPKPKETDLIVHAIIKQSGQESKEESQPVLIPEFAEHQDPIDANDQGRVIWLDRYKSRK